MIIINHNSNKVLVKKMPLHADIAVASYEQYGVSTVWKSFQTSINEATKPRYYWPFVTGIYRWAVNCSFKWKRFHFLESSWNLCRIKVMDMWIWCHYSDVTMGAIASQITGLTIVYSTVYSGADQRKHQSSASLALSGEFTGVRWIPRTKGQYRGKSFHLMTSSWPETMMNRFVHA